MQSIVTVTFRNSLEPQLRRLCLITTIAITLAAVATPRAHAQGGVVNSGSTSAPEIDPSMVGGGVALLGGIVMVLRSKRRR